MRLLSTILIGLCALTAGSYALEVQDHEMTASSLPAKNTELQLFYTPWCPYSQKVLNYLKQIHKTVPMRNIQNDPAGKELLKSKGGNAQVPCLFIDGKPLYESDAIIQWLSKHKDSLPPA
jgi:glutaredoxin